MNFVIPAGSATNLPKEIVQKIVHDAVESSAIVKLVANRQQMIPIANEGTIPVIGAEDLDKYYRLDSTDDITTLTENSMTIKTPDLAPKEIGSFIYLKTKAVKQYPELQLDQLFETRLARGMARVMERLVVVGDTEAVGATNTLNICNGIYTIANDSDLCANAPLEYDTSEAADMLDIVSDGIESLGEYGNEDNANDLFLFASSTFMASCRKAASKDYVGYTIEPVAELGLQKVVHLHGIPVFKRTNITGEKAVLANMKGAFIGYFENIGLEMQRDAGKRADLLVHSFWIDATWAFLDNSSKATGIVLIRKATS
jgi:hypothetical protein